MNVMRQMRFNFQDKNITPSKVEKFPTKDGGELTLEFDFNENVIQAHLKPGRNTQGSYTESMGFIEFMNTTFGERWYDKAIDHIKDQLEKEFIKKEGEKP